MKYSRENPRSRSAGLLVSLLVRYTEIATVHFEPREMTLRFSFLVTREIAAREFSAFRLKLTETLKTFFHLERRECRTLAVERSGVGQVTLIEITRDVFSFCQEELSMIVTLLAEEYEELLVRESGDSLLEEDALFQEEIIQEMLEDLKETRGERNLKAYREAGRVVVFTGGPHSKP